VFVVGKNAAEDKNKRNAMPIDVLTERTYPISDLVRKLPTRRSKSTLKNWCIRGVKASHHSDERIKMEYVVVGGVLHSSVEAYKRWTERLTHEWKKYH